MSILIDLRSVIDEGVGASLTTSGDTTALGTDLRLGDIDYCCVNPICYDINFIHAGEAIHATIKVNTDLSTACVRCLCDFAFPLTSEVEETYFFEPTDDEHGDPYPTISDDEKVDIEPLIREALLVEAPFAPIHDDNCQGLCVKCGTDLNESDCGCEEDSDSSHPFASLKDIIK